MHKSLCYFLFIVVVSISIQNCASRRAAISEPLDDPETQDQFVYKLDTQYPDTFALSQRIILNIRGKQYDFLGQLMIEKGKAFRAIAFGDMGGLFLDILHRDGQTTILSNPSSIPEKPLILGVAEDIAQIFDYCRGNEDLIKDPQGRLGIQQLNDDATLNEYIFNKETGLLQQTSVVEDNTVIKQIQFKNYSDFENTQKPLPSVIVAENSKWHYSMEIYLLKFKPEFDCKKAFQLTGEPE